jgi:HlyD family secretion protein
MKMHAGLLLLALLFAVKQANDSLAEESIEPVVLRVSGVVEVPEVIVRSPVSGRLTQATVSLGQRVEEGEVLAVLDTEPLRREVDIRKARVQLAELEVDALRAMAGSEEQDQAEAVVQRARARLAELLAGPGQEKVAIAEAVLKRALAEEAILKRECDRQKQRHDAGITTAAEYEKAQGAYEIAAAKAQEAQARLDGLKKGPTAEEIEQQKALVRLAEARLKLVERGLRLRQDRVQQAQIRLELAKEALDAAEERLAGATLRSPISGVVIAKHVEAGDRVRAMAPVVMIADMARPSVRTYIKETDIRRVKVGMTAGVTFDAFPGVELEGYVSSIAVKAEPVPRGYPRPEKAGQRVFRVEVSLASPEVEIRPGVSANVEIVVEVPEQASTLSPDRYRRMGRGRTGAESGQGAPRIQPEEGP